MVTTTTAGSSPSKRQIYTVMSGVMIAMLLAMLDNMIVGTAMPRIVGELGGLSHFSWVVTSYVLASTVTAPIAGKLGDLFGQKKVMLTAIGVFLGGSVLAGMSQTMGQLIAFRALQGIGGGALMVGAIAVIGALVPPRERGRYQGLIAAVMPVAMIGGPLLGGFITDNLSWRWAFYVNIPIGLIALAVIAVTLKLPVVKKQHKIDYWGAALITAGISALVLLTTWGGNEYAWGSWQIVLLAVAGVLALTAFVAVERKAAEPILPLSLFRDRNFVVVSAIGFLLGFALFGSTTFLPQYQQLVQGASATNSGLLLTPLMLSSMVVALISGQVITRTGRYKVFPVLGGAVMTLGAVLLATIDAHTSEWQLSLYMIVFGLGMGALMNVVTLVSQNSVSKENIGVASSSATFFRQIGGSFGTALFGAIFANRLQETLTSALGAKGGALTSAQGAVQPSMLGKLPAPVREAFVDGVANATSSVFAVGAILTAVVFGLAWLIKEVPLRGNESDDASAPEPETDTASVSDGDRTPVLV